MPYIRDKSAEDCSLEPIAICGMACRLPGSVDSASKLWDLLVKKGSVQTPRVPKNRFNIDAYFHKNLERPGSFNVLGGYFLDGALEDFDPTFFEMTPIEAMWMDPQQRKMLEVSYECLESAGLTLDAVAGSNTAVFVGSFTSDYQQMSIRDPDFRHNYAATGVDPGIISNRIGNTFNLKGPAFTINTACSSSIYAIHNACNALRARDCEAAIAGGVNLILTVDQHMNTAKLGILSPTSTCHTFDASADGYGRAEGAGALYLKRLSDAIRDGDPVRGVLRSSAVNTNGKVAGMGITHPSHKGQERVVRNAYEKAKLDPSKTAYLECHGTGTPVGDPIEARAVANAMNDRRSSEKPLLIGAIKANIGHSEAASGIFAIMKAAMMTEAGTIPGVAGFKTLNPAIDEKGWNIKINADTAKWPRDFQHRRAGVSSFGYGGTNGHVIVEAVDSLFPFYQHGQPKSVASYDNSTTRPLLVSLSAHDKGTLIRNINAHAQIADKFYLADLAHTLNTRRTKFRHRAFTIAREGHGTEDLAAANFKFATSENSATRVGFVFTGQGAQWAGMAVEAMKTFPSFLQTVRSLDQVLHALNPPPTWKLEEVLLAPVETSPINDPEIAQPICTAIQIAIVDIFAHWDITPTVTAGHSSGEIGAAYAAGFISAPEAIIAAFYRGFAVKRHAPSGAMLAAGVGVKEIFDHISDLSQEVVVACENSPSSVTLSGTFEAIAKVKVRLDTAKIFARELKTGKAYHSPQMQAVAPAYNEVLQKAYATLGDIAFDWRHPQARMISSVTGQELKGDSISADYWSLNLRSRVLFDSAITTLCQDASLKGLSCIVEIGPSSALKGPFKQICSANKYAQYTYIPTFVRGSDSAVCLLKTAGELLIRNYSLDVESVNSLEEITDERLAARKNRRPLILVDLPPYQWDYSNRFWAEARFSQEQRSLTHARHDLLGSQIAGLSDQSLTWRNMLRHKDIPWLKDHSLGGAAVFPAAGHMSLAIEALRQVCELKNVQLKGVTLRDVAIKTALVIPETDNGIEVQLRFRQSSKSSLGSSWYSFVVESISEGGWTSHCEGIISPSFQNQSVVQVEGSPVDIAKLTQRVTGKRWYDAFHRVGFQYGPSFQPLSQIRTNSKYHHAAANVTVSTESGLMIGESRYILHPSTVDACLQLIIISINAGQHKEMPWGVVPIGIEEVSLWFPGSSASSKGKAVAWTDELDGRYFNTHTKLVTEAGELVLDVKGLRCVAYEAAIPQGADGEAKPEPYSQASWQPEVSESLSMNGTVHRREEVTIFSLEKRTSQLEDLAIRLSQGSCTVQLKSFSDFIASQDQKIIIYDVQGHLLLNTGAEVFNNLKTILCAGVPVIWLTAGVNEGKAVAGGMAQGFLRAIRSEQAAAKIITVDVDLDESIESIGNFIERKLNKIGTKDSGVDTEFWLHNGMGHICRVVPNDELNDQISAAVQVAEAAILPPGKALRGRVVDQGLVFESVGSCEQAAVGASDVEVQISCSEIDAKDQGSPATTPRVVAGEIISVGHALDKSLIGNHVVTYTVDVFSTVIRVPESTCATFSDVKAVDLMATLPSLSNAVNVIMLTSNLRGNEQVLLLPAPIQTVGAVYTLSRALGFKLDVVVETEEEKEKYMVRIGLTQDAVLLTKDVGAVGARVSQGSNSGPLVVIAQEFSNLSQEVWRLMPPFGQFVLNDVVIDHPPDMLPFTRGVSFHSTSITTLYKRDKTALGKVLKLSLDILEQHRDVLIENRSAIDVEALTDAGVDSATLRESGVLTYSYGASSVKIIPSAKELQFSPNATYLLVGCLGGLGRSLTAWMMEHGCRHFAFISRSGTDRSEAAQVVDAITNAGATVDVFRADASVEEDVVNAVRQVSPDHPIKGVVHAAMVLQDTMFERMTYEQFTATVTPKVKGALNLHRALQSSPLDFFIMTSSISAVLGNPGQANYCAANSYLDSLALHRRTHCLPATSLALPMILDIGVVAENESIEASLSRKGMYGITEAEVLKAFETAMSQPGARPGKTATHGAAHIVLGLEPSKLAPAVAAADTADAYWYTDARFASLRSAVEVARTSTTSKTSAGDFVSSLKSMQGEGPETVLSAIVQHVVKRCASILMTPVESFELDGRSISSYGLDSMIGAELRNWLFREFGLDVGFQTLLGPKLSFWKLAELVRDNLWGTTKDLGNGLMG